MSKTKLAKELRALALSHVRRAKALADELAHWSAAGFSIATPESIRRREELRRTLEQAPTQIAEEARVLLSDDKAYAGYRSRLKRAAADQNVQVVLAEITLIAQALCAEAKEDEAVEMMVTLDQAAGTVHRSKRTLERYLENKKIPRPDVEAPDGQANLWKWRTLRPVLEKLFGLDLPERFPADRFR